MNTIISLLGFSNLVEDEIITKIKNFGLDIIVPYDCGANGIDQEIILYARNIHFEEEKDEVVKSMRKYIDHPRLSYLHLH